MEKILEYAEWLNDEKVKELALHFLDYFKQNHMIDGLSYDEYEKQYEMEGACWPLSVGFVKWIKEFHHEYQDSFEVIDGMTRDDYKRYHAVVKYNDRVLDLARKQYNMKFDSVETYSIDDFRKMFPPL